MAKIFGSTPSPSAPPPPPPPPTRDDAADRVAKEEAAKATLRKNQGRSSTLLTGGQGVAEEAPVQKKQLLGQ